jgi:hypothetical protein
MSFCNMAKRCISWGNVDEGVFFHSTLSERSLCHKEVLNWGREGGSAPLGGKSLEGPEPHLSMVSGGRRR